MRWTPLSLCLPPGEWIRPPRATRLAEIYLSFAEVQSSMVQDFDLLAGHLLSGTYSIPEGVTPPMGIFLRTEPLSFTLADNEHVGAVSENGDLSFEVMAPAGVYCRPGLADTISMSFLLEGSEDREPAWRANTVTLQGNQVYRLPQNRAPVRLMSRVGLRI